VHVHAPQQQRPIATVDTATTITTGTGANATTDTGAATATDGRPHRALAHA
jgi:hypothetical protein